MIKALLTIALVALAGPGASATLVEATRHVWEPDEPAFGGFSGLVLTPDGADFLVVNDQGYAMEGHLHRDAAGNIVRMERGRMHHLKGPDGLFPPVSHIDSEGAALARDGGFFISFERTARVLYFSSGDATPRLLPVPPWFKSLQYNSGLEALAIDAAGTLYTIPERSGQWERPFPVYRYSKGKWDRRLSIPRRERYLVTGAEFGPDGYLYVLERHYVLLIGFTSRVRRFKLGPEGFTDEETILQTPFGRLDNMEAIAVWRDHLHQIRVLLIADDNFRPLQQNLVVEYILDGAGAVKSASPAKPRPLRAPDR